MEELLQSILKEANGTKLSSLNKTTNEALELLSKQDNPNLPKRQSNEVRRVCLTPLQISLETKKNKLVNYAIKGFHKLLRDDRFYRGVEPEDDSQWLPSQVLCATASIMQQLPDTQVQIFRLYLALALSPRRTLNGRLCIWTCSRCSEAANTSPPVAAAAKAAAAQTIRAYCNQLDEESQELLSECSPLGRSHLVAVSCYSEIIPVIQYLCGRLSEIQQTPKQNYLALFFLDCLVTLMSSLSNKVSGNTHFTTFLWQKFCPSLIYFLGTPRIDKNIKSKDHEGSVGDSGRGSATLGCAPSFNNRQAKAIYSIANQLVRLVGSTPNLRPVLEALYHRMLLYPPTAHRVEPLRSVRELLQNPKRLKQLILMKGDGVDTYSDDMAIVRLITDGIEECGRSGNPEVISAAVECVVALLDALQKLCTESEEYISGDQADIILKRWPKLQDADYMGPLTYQTLARLPSPYRDVVADLQTDETNDSSDTSGPENVSSGSEGEAEVDSDADNVFLPTRQNHPENKEKTATPKKDNVKTIPKTLNIGRCTETECNVDLERHNARLFIKTLQFSLLPKLLNLRTCIEVDEAMQEFASKCCQHNAAQPPTSACIMNADGVYLATYSALLLTLKLKRANYYHAPSKTNLLQTEDEFVEEVQGSGVLVYLSATWLRELYQQILAHDLLKDAKSAESALFNLLSDLGGLDQNPLMSDWQKLKEVSMLYNINETPETQASFRWARRILTCIWDSMVTVLSIPLIGTKNKRQKLHGIISKKIKTFGKKQQIAWEGLTIQCLEGLHKAARISNTLSLQSRCSDILGLLAKSAVSQPPNGKILATHALSLDILISGGLELGSKAPDCWEHIFAACQYVSSLEHSLFGQQGNNAIPIVTMQTGRNKTVSIVQSDAFALDAREDETCVDVFNFLQPTFDSPITSEMTVSKIVETCRQENGNIITGSNAARVCCALSTASDALFSRLAATSTLPTVRDALKRLAKCHYKPLYSEWEQDIENNNIRWWRRNQNKHNSAGEASRSLCRMGDLTLRCLKAVRPLAHRMSIWTVVGPHFMQVACHKDIQISSLAIQCLHDCATTLLNQQVELSHFHFNEALLKPFENLLCLELCDDDIQEQIIACLCELVETNNTEIRSGWRPLFNTLRAANNAKQYSAVLEIFKVFLSTDNTLVFTNAALDCILCLVSHIKGLHFEEGDKTESKQKQITNKNHLNIPFGLKFNKNSKLIPFNEEKTEKIIVNMCKEALYYLENCAEILTMMYNMPKCPIFNTGNRVKGDLPLAVVDPLIPSITPDVTNFITNENYEEESVSYRKLSTSLPPSNTANNSLLKLDKPSNVLKVWYVLIEELTSATLVCSKKNQPAVMETLFKLLKNAIDCPGTHFGLHCINHLLLPMVQNWLRQIPPYVTNCDSIMPNFKQCCGMTTDTIAFYLHKLQNVNTERYNLKSKEKEDAKLIESPEITFALKQLMVILVECIAQPQEPIARLGASCIRHIILLSGHELTENQWSIICTSLHRACNVCLTPLKQITYAFKENSNSFYGDLAMVKVAARRDCSINDNVRLHAMAQQVFLNEIQRLESHPKLVSKNSAQNLMLIDDRSYVFLIYVNEVNKSSNQDMCTIRIPHRALIVGLLAQQILVQIIATVLIQASSDVFQGINVILLESLKTGADSCNYKFRINEENITLLLKSLELSYKRTMQFDFRPGLKFLVQKVSNLDFAANLYKHTTSSWLIKMIALTELFYNGIQEFKLVATDIRIILQRYFTPLNLTLDYDRYINKIFDLKETWELLCNSYIKHVIHVSDFDENDDFDKQSCSSIDTDSSCNNYGQYYMEDIDENRDQIEKNTEPVEDIKPFTFADFKKNSEVEIDENCYDDEKINRDTNVDEKKISVEEIKTEKTNGNVTTNPFINPEPLKEEKTTLNRTDSDLAERCSRENKNTIIIKDKLINNTATSTGESLIPPPQPVPPEIEEERALSISKDTEVQRNCFQNILTAYLELILTFPKDRLRLITPVLHLGFTQLSKTVTDAQLLERINIFLDRKDFS